MLFLLLIFEMKYLALAAMFSVKEPWPIAKSLTGLVISLVPLSFNGYQCNANLVTFLVVAWEVLAINHTTVKPRPLENEFQT